MRNIPVKAKFGTGADGHVKQELAFSLFNIMVFFCSRLSGLFVHVSANFCVISELFSGRRKTKEQAGACCKQMFIAWASS